MRLNYDCPSYQELATRFHYNRTKLLKVLEDFENSDKSIAEIVMEPEEYSSLKSLQNAMNACAKRQGKDIHVVLCNGRAYLAKGIVYYGK